jgi:hypothetical protein
MLISINRTTHNGILVSGMLSKETDKIMHNASCYRSFQSLHNRRYEISMGQEQKLGMASPDQLQVSIHLQVCMLPYSFYFNYHG